MNNPPTPTPAEPSEMQQFEALLEACVTGLRDCARLDEEGCDDSAVYTHAVMNSADAYTAIRAFVASLAKDKARVDFMQEHGASVEASDNETLSCAVQSSEDFAVSGSSATYNIRAAIDAAIDSERKQP